MSERVMELAVKILEASKHKRLLEANLDLFKEEIYRELVQLNKSQIVAPINENEEIVVRCNVRFTKPFDKDGLAAQAGVDRSDLDYAGVARLVDEGTVRVEDVEKYQGENKAEFITVRVRKVRKKKDKSRVV